MRWALARVLSLWAAWRRRIGRYDRFLLRLRWAAYALHPGPDQLLELAMCRRDYGRVLPRRWRAALNRQAARGGSLRQRRVRALLQDGNPEHCRDMHEKRMRFARWWAAQLAAPRGACVVGNAAGLEGERFGALIDAHAVVVRFNTWAGPGAAKDDTGERIDVWVCAPNVNAPPPVGIRWAVISGPDPQAQLAAWPTVQTLERRGVEVLTVPLPVWRRLVNALQAPPSAGVLTLAWLHSLAGTWQGLHVVGIGWGPRVDGRHHLLTSNGSAGRRHRWDAEQGLVARWRAEGLSDLRSQDQ